MEQRVVCAAIKFGPIVIVGVRHFDSLMHSMLRKLSINPMREHVQGFVDNQGSFLTREEAWLVAEAQGQIIRRVGGDETIEGDVKTGHLYSENLY